MVKKDYRSVCVMYRVSKVNVLAWVNGLNCLQSHPRSKSWVKDTKSFFNLLVTHGTSFAFNKS